MSAPGSRTARLVQAWVRLYTSGLPDEAGERRRSELESDLWEQLNDPGETHSTVSLMGRWLRGIPADVWWRYRTIADTRRTRVADLSPDGVDGSRWWAVLVVVVAISKAAVAVASAIFGDGGSGAAVIGATGGVVAALLMLVGVAVRRGDVVAGSWLITIGAFVGTDPIALPVAALVVISGVCTANLQFSDQPDELRVVVAQRQRLAMTRRWYLWLGAAPILFGIGLLFPLFVYDDAPAASSTDHPDGLAALADIAAWMTWWGTWLGAAACAAVGVLLGILHATSRLRAQRSRPGGV